MIDPALIDGVEVLSLDAGNVIVFMDHERLSRILKRAGLVHSPESLRLAEREARVLQEAGKMTRIRWPHENESGARSWGAMLATIMERAGAPTDLLVEILVMLWHEHHEFNLWSKVPEGLVDSVRTLRERGVPTFVLSNSEGRLDRLFRRLDIFDVFAHVIDSGVLGIEKPDVRIFRALEEVSRSTPGKILHLGDTIATDVDGAVGAGWRVALVDPNGFVEGQRPEIPRVPGARDVALALSELRARAAGTV